MAYIPLFGRWNNNELQVQLSLISMEIKPKAIKFDYIESQIVRTDESFNGTPLN